MNKSLLKDKNFLLLMFGKLVSLLGSNMQQFALSLYVLDKTGSATIFASILAISIFPRLLLTPFAGVFGDWFNRKKSIVVLDLLNGIMIGVFAFIYFKKGDLSIFIIYILVILLEITEIFFSAAMSGIIPSMVEKNQLMEANSIDSVVMNIGSLLSPIIGSFLYGYFSMGLILIFNSVSFILSGISEYFVDIPERKKTVEKISFLNFKRDLMEGILAVKENKLIRVIIGMIGLINALIGPLFSIGLSYILRELLLVSSKKFGLYQFMLSLPMIIVPLIFSKINKEENYGKIVYKTILSIGIIAFLLSIVMLSYLDGFLDDNIRFILIVLAGLMISGLATVTNIAMSTIFSGNIDLDLMGRTSVIMGLISTGLTPIGQITFGFLYDKFLPSLPILICGLSIIIVSSKYKKLLYNYKKIGD